MCMGSAAVGPARQIDRLDSQLEFTETRILGSGLRLDATRVISLQLLIVRARNQYTKCQLRLPTLQSLGRTRGRLGLARGFVQRR
jgi:hypothetical protein